MDEQQAILRLQQGDLSGLEFLVQRYQVQAVHSAYLIIGEYPPVEDVGPPVLSNGGCTAPGKA